MSPSIPHSSRHHSRDPLPVLTCPLCRRSEPLLLLVSGTPRNPGRPFLKCGAGKVHCKPYFRWLDEYVDELTDVLNEELNEGDEQNEDSKDGDLLQVKRLNRQLAQALDQQKTLNFVAFACLFATCAFFMSKKK